jgi:hypothetical protein
MTCRIYKDGYPLAAGEPAPRSPAIPQALAKAQGS